MNQPQSQTWDPESYARHARFVSDLAGPVLALLDAQPGERILDLGCGDGALTKKLAELGCDVIGVDAGPDMIRAARELGLDARVVDGHELSFEREFDAVFSNAALHWMKRDPDAVVAGVARALKPGGRFVGEFGGHGNVAAIVTDYFARSGPAFATGRAEGKGILHATLAVRHDWSGNSPLHLGQFFVVRLAEPLKAYHGEGDHAPDASQRQVQKAVRIIDGRNRQRMARQIFLPKAWEYERAFVVMHEGTTDSGLLRALKTFARGPLPFEL